jgi:hypothetical protein
LLKFIDLWYFSLGFLKLFLFAGNPPHPPYVVRNEGGLVEREPGHFDAVDSFHSFVEKSPFEHTAPLFRFLSLAENFSGS